MYGSVSNRPGFFDRAHLWVTRAESTPFLVPFSRALAPGRGASRPRPWPDDAVGVDSHMHRMISKISKQVLLTGRFVSKSGQRPEKCLTLLERALIRYFLSNKQGVRLRRHGDRHSHDHGATGGRVHSHSGGVQPLREHRVRMPFPASAANVPRYCSKPPMEPHRLAQSEGLPHKCSPFISAAWAGFVCEPCL